jgi:hypothetical protein
LKPERWGPIEVRGEEGPVTRENDDDNDNNNNKHKIIRTFDKILDSQKKTESFNRKQTLTTLTTYLGLKFVGGVKKMGVELTRKP